MLSEVVTNSCFYENALDTKPQFLRSRVQGGEQIECVTMPSQGAFAVRENRQEFISPIHPPDGSEFSQRDVVVPGNVSRLSCCFPDHRQSSRPPPRSFCMSMGQFRIDVQQLASCKDVSPHRLRQVLRQTFQLSTHAGRQQGLVKVFGCGRLVLRWSRPRFWYAALLILTSASASRFVAIRLPISCVMENSHFALSASLEAPTFSSASRIALSLPLLMTKSTVATVTALVPRCLFPVSLSFVLVPPFASPGLPSAAPEFGSALPITRTAAFTTLLAPGTIPRGFSFKTHGLILPKRPGEPNFHHVWGGVVVGCGCAPTRVWGVWGHLWVVCPAASYSPTHSRVQYHQRWEA